MATDVQPDLKLEIAHILTIDVVAYSTLLITEQSRLMADLVQAVRAAPRFRRAEAEGKLIRLPTGDGMALVFFNDPEAPIECAMQISAELKQHPEIKLRMGIHSGPINQIVDVNDRSNVAGAGIDMAQRVMDCGDAGHILLSQRVADDLAPHPRWNPHLHRLGECEVKHGHKISLVNFYTGEVGNSAAPAKVQSTIDSAKALQTKPGRRNLLLFGSQKTESSPSTPATRVRTSLLLLIGLGIAISIFAGFFLLPRASAKKIEKSIAVLPFQNLSEEKQNAFFADGIQDDILTNLAKIGDLKVISRTSVMSYRDKPQSVRAIGKALGVSAILEGSVRKINNRVRVNVQLINAANDAHIWAEEYDRDLTDVFAIQSDLAQKIAQELQAKLSPDEKAELTRKPTENAEAYLAFVQARNLFVPDDQAKIEQGEQLYERALQLDPTFALAAAGLSHLQSWIYHSTDPTPSRRERARALAQRALQLRPDLPEGHLALGFSYYYGDSNFEAAEKEFAIAQKGLPNESEAYLALGAIQRRQGRWPESTANLEKAAELNPNATWPLQNLAFNYQMLRDFNSANRTVDRALKIDSNNMTLHGLKAKFALAEKGDLSVALRTLEGLEKMPPNKTRAEILVTGKVGLLLLQRKFEEALRTAETIPDDQLTTDDRLLCGKYLFIGISRHCLKDEEGARAPLTKAKEMAEARLKENPDSWDAHLHRGYALAYLGDKAGAAAEAERAMQALPESKDAFNGPDVTETAAKIYAAIGDKDRAINLITGLLQRPAALTVAALRVDPQWDPLRSDPRFQALIAKQST